ncbi:hypothetical protein BDZ94DRAFT_1273243 [Collybia nuda]|uniref:Uncharacterized protein n=1 Tax=Collybia nuda TaxID=64659 RepID=A0A9P5XVE2_9AGAR|nr:hypothetical protein BDZ94DRAFT_1273243 [Collybia nuda]
MTSNVGVCYIPRAVSFGQAALWLAFVLYSARHVAFVPARRALLFTKAHLEHSSFPFSYQLPAAGDSGVFRGSDPNL